MKRACRQLKAVTAESAAAEVEALLLFLSLKLDRDEEARAEVDTLIGSDGKEPELTLARP